MPRPLTGLVALAACAALGACYAMRGSSGGGQTDFRPPRLVRASDVAVPRGYRVEAVASGLTFPSAVLFDAERSAGCRAIRSSMTCPAATSRWPARTSARATR